MSVYRNIPIARKFIFAFGLVCTLCVALGVYTYFALREIQTQATDSSENSLPSLLELVAMRGALDELRIYDLDLLLNQNADWIARQSQLRKKAEESIRTTNDRYAPHVDNGRERELYDKVRAGIAQYQQLSDRAAAALEAGKTADALDVMSSTSTSDCFNGAMASMSELLSFNIEEAESGAGRIAKSSLRSIWVTLGVTLFIVGLSGLIGMGLTRVIAPRIERAMEALRKLAAKDLTAHLNVSGTDEIGQLGEALNACVGTLKRAWCNPSQGVRRLCRRRPPRSAPAPCKRPATPMRSPIAPTRSPPRRRR